MSVADDPSGLAFERRVADLYRATGADVVRDVDLAGSQVDLLVVERTPSGAMVRTVVECKSGSKQVGVDAVTRLSNLMAGFKRAAVADLGVLVSERGFTRQAREKAAQDGLLLFEVADLEQRSDGRSDLKISVRRVIAEAGSLRHQFQQTLRSPERLTAFELDDLAAHVAKVLDRVQETLILGSEYPTAAPQTRTALGALTRIQDGAELCLDAVHYVRRVTEVVEESERVPGAPGGTEADHAAAVFIRLRELDQARSQLRYRLQRLEDACRRTAAE